VISDLIGWLIIGLLIGAVARFLVPGRDPMGCLATSLVGICGAFLGGFLSRLLLPYHHAHPILRPGFLVSLAGAVIVVLIVRSFRKK